MTNAIDSIFGSIKASKDKPKFGTNKSSKGSNLLSKPISRHKESKTSIQTPIKVKARKNAGTSADPFQLSKTEQGAPGDFTEEGYRVYTPEELNIGKGRDTADCPFDCKCCF